MVSTEKVGNINELLNLNISSMNKPTLLVKAKELQDALKERADNTNTEYILKRLEILEKKQIDNDFEIRSLKTENKRLLKKIRDNQHDIDEIDERIIELERTVNNVDQYIRRENFEVSGIPDDISQDNLEDEVINIINTITNDTIASRDIEACH